MISNHCFATYRISWPYPRRCCLSFLLLFRGCS